MFMWLLYLLPYVLVPIGLFPVLRWLIRKVRDGISAIGEKKTTAASHIIKLKKATLRLPVCIIVFLFLACSLGFGFWEVIINNFYYGALSLLLSLRVFPLAAVIILLLVIILGMPLVSLSLPFASRCKDHSVWTDRLYIMSLLMTLIWIILLAIQQDKRICFGEGCRSWMDIDLRGERIALVLLIINLFIQPWYIAIMPAERNAHIPVPVLHSGENTGMSSKTVSLMENPGAAESNRDDTLSSPAFRQI